MYGVQASINELVWDNGCSQMVSGPTRGDSILDIYLVRSESSFISCRVVLGISDHNGVLLEVDWAEYHHGAKGAREIPLYHKTDTPGLQAFLREKFRLWAGSGSCVEETLITFKEIIFEGIKCHEPKKTLSNNPNPGYYNRAVKRLKVKVRKVYNQSKYSQNIQVELIRLSKELPLAKKKAPETGEYITIGIWTNYRLI
jgi:hypothetical protein